eukprot:jgi/Bigna1/126237/aug1.2_g945
MYSTTTDDVETVPEDEADDVKTVPEDEADDVKTVPEDQAKDVNKAEDSEVKTDDVHTEAEEQEEEEEEEEVDNGKSVPENEPDDVKTKFVKFCKSVAANPNAEPLLKQMNEAHNYLGKILHDYKSQHQAKKKELWLKFCNDFAENECKHLVEEDGKMEFEMKLTNCVFKLNYACKN